MDISQRCEDFKRVEKERLSEDVRATWQVLQKLVEGLMGEEPPGKTTLVGVPGLGNSS